MHRYPWAASVAAIVMLAVGCSSESDTADDQADGAAGTTAGSGGAGGSSAGTGGSSAGTGGSSAGTGGSSTGSGGSSTGGTGATGGSGSGATDGGAGTNATGGAGGTGNIQCGTSQCSGPSQYCCDNYNEPDECLASGATCVYGVVVECDGPEDCAGQVCCATLFIRGQARAIDNIRCAADCSGNDDRVVCGASDSCPTGQTCGTSEILPTYRDCK